MQYDTTQPRISIVSPGNEYGEQREMEIGQGSSWKEALFFMTVCNYRISVARWNGSTFAQAEYYVAAQTT